MLSIDPSIVAALISTALLAAVYCYLYKIFREGHTGIWALSWAACSLRFASDAIGHHWGMAALTALASPLFNLASGLLLLWGLYIFMGRKMPGWWVPVTAMGAVWITGAFLLEIPFVYRNLPLFVFLGIIFLWTGFVFLRHREIKGAAKQITGWTFIIWGLHKLDYPFLRSLDWFASWGHLITALLTTMVAVGILLAYIQKTIDDLRESKMYLQTANEELEAAVEELNAAEEELRQQFEELQKKEEHLRESEEKYRTVFESTGTAILVSEEDTTISMANAELERLTGYPRQDLVGRKRWTEFVHPEDLGMMKKYHLLRRSDPGGTPDSYEFRLVNRAGGIRHIFLTVALFPGTKKSVGSLLDITEKKLADEKIKYLSLHDPLTGLYNRTYFEEEMRRLEAGQKNPTGIIICDVDGLKLINDTFGHSTGDSMLVAAAGLIKSSLAEYDVVARIGGDEFAALLPDSPRPAVEEARRKIKDGVLEHNRLRPDRPMSISTGFSVRNSNNISLNDLFKDADNHMHREKLHSHQSARNAIVQTMMKALEARDYITEGHADRLQDLVVGLASGLGLQEQRIRDLRLLAQFHDIGKVGIPDRILFKPGPLTAEEYAEMKRHCEIGHRIARSALDLDPIADWILKHHEWWNGQGYPLGIRGEEIPLECRILAIADAYDAMTSDRPYRKALSRREALREIEKNSGAQFDPSLVDMFVNILQCDQSPDNCGTGAAD